jgi:hypothetical protein
VPRRELSAKQRRRGVSVRSGAVGLRRDRGLVLVLVLVLGPDGV